MKTRFTIRKITIAIIAFVIVVTSADSTAQLVISNQGASASTILSGFIGNGLTISNPFINCTSTAYGTFSGGTTLGMTNGIVLTTGNASQLSNPASYFMSTSNNFDINDPQLMSLDASAKKDVCILEFDVIPSCDNLSVRFVFGSEEYPNYVNSSYNDAFGFFVTGQNPVTGGAAYLNKNIAIVTGTTPCSIDNVNAGANSSYYVNNSTGTVVPFGGYTTAITSSLAVVPCQSYHFKMAIADAGDHIFDSGVFVDFLQCTNVMGVTTTSTPPSCGVDNGTATALPTGGIGALSYSWSPAPGSGQGTANASGLVGGTAYTVTVDDAYSCILPVTSVVTISTTTSPVITNSPLTQSVCSGSSTSAVTLTANLAGSTFTWTAVASTGISGFATSGSSLIPVQALINSTSSVGTVTYTMIPTLSGCSGPAVNYVITVNPSITPTFTAVASICSGATAPVLPTSSTNTPAITGTWNSLVSNTASGIYTFTPTAGQCATTTTLFVTVTPNVTPTFTAVASICSGATVPILPTSSTNTPAITGTWSPAVSNTATGTYSFTPTAGQCATTSTLSVTVNPNVTPTFAAVAAICSGATAPTLPTSSTNTPAIIGTWSSLVSNTTSGTYTFTPSAGQCATTTTLSVTVTANVAPIFASVASICSGATSPILLTSSTNTPAITGTWSSLVSNTASGTYTFTPTAGQCATTTTLSVTVSPNVTPTFAAVAAICSGSTAPILPTSSINTPAITGTWSSLVSNTASGTYTFTPTTGQCATTTTLSILVSSGFTPTFAAIASICLGATAPVLPSSSTNTPAITGTWSPLVSNTASGTYTFTPTAGQCATTTTLSVTVTPNVTPTFTTVASICSGATAPVLPTSSTNTPAITGTWSSLVSNTASGTYTFTSAAGQCATTSTLSVTVTPNVTPTFSALAAICSGATAPVLPISSTNTPAITGTWSSLVSNTASGTYTFTPTAGQCTTTTTLSVTVSLNVTPTFAAVAAICSGATAPALPISSTNTPAITGTWSSMVSNTASGTYTFAPTVGQCATTTTLSVTVIPNVSPTFAAVAGICSGATAPVLPISSTNTPAITGAWSSLVSNSASGTYTFTPTAGQCATITTLSVTITPNVTPIFSAVSSICSGATAPVLPTISTNTPAITGTWSSLVSNTATATYTFTPTAGQCANTTTLSVTVNPNVTPTFAAVAAICSGATAPILPTNSTNTPAITGTWSSLVSNTASGTYTFTPTVGQCATTKTLSVIVTPNVTPTFTAVTAICSGAVAPILPTSSTNIPAITGVWSTLVNNISTGTYTFIPTAGLCATTTTLSVIVNPNVAPIFAAVASICSGSIAPTLPTNSINTPAITGTWSPLVSNTTTGTYTFTPTSGLCATTATLSITVIPNVIPTFSAVAPICSGDIAPVLPSSSTNSPAIIGTWSSLVSNTSTGTYIFTPTAGQCATVATLSIFITPLPIVNAGVDQIICVNSSTILSGSGAFSYAWNNNVTNAVTFIPELGTNEYVLTGIDVVGCINYDTVIVTVNPQVIPSFTAISPICFGSDAPVLAISSNNIPSINGGWFPVINVSIVGTSVYTFIPNADECAATTTMSITVKSNPVLVITNPLPVCAPLTVDLTSASVTAGSNGSLFYYLDETGSTQIPQPSAISESNTYYIGSVSNEGCQVISPVIARINISPIASFTPSNTEISASNPRSVMINSSIDASEYEWSFNDIENIDDDSSHEESPAHVFTIGEQKDFFVKLVATSINGCQDSTAAVITLKEQLMYFVPNSFTPDGDEVNDTFEPVFTSGYDPYSFSMLIFNRWGEIVFETHDASKGWNGMYGTDFVAQEGTYTWVIDFTIKQDEKKVKITGHVNLIK